METPSSSSDLEVQMERSFGGIGIEVDRDIVCVDPIQGPNKRYEPISAADYLQQRIDANFVAE